MKYLMTLFALLILVSCARTIQYSTLDKTSNENKATIYVMRPSIIASALNFRIYQDKLLKGELGPKSYLSWEVDPADGKITIMSVSENTSNLSFIPQAGQTYYIKQKMKMGVLSTRTELELLEDEEAKKALKKLRAPLVKG